MNMTKPSMKSGTETAAEIQQLATELAGQASQAASDAARMTVRMQRDAIAQYAQSLANAAAAASAELRNEGYAISAEQLLHVSRSIGSFKKSVKGHDAQSVVEDIVRLVRKNPALTFGLAAVAGYALVKLSNASEQSTRSTRRAG